MGARRVLVLVGLSACGGKAVVDAIEQEPATTTGSGAATTTATASTTANGGAGSFGGAAPVGGSEACAPCDPNDFDEPVYLFHECTPPLQVGCPAVTCTPGASDCADGEGCESWGAAACCYCAAVVPACVVTGPAQGPLPEYLKISPTSAPAGEGVTLAIQGFPFYVGALYYLATVGGSGELFQGGGGVCSFTVEVPPGPTDRVPVWVSQYGGNEPWVLAGFFEWYTSDYPEACTQPGYPCSTDTASCCQSPEVPVQCIGGRCRRP